MNKISVIGAGFVGCGCAQLFLRAGFDVMLSNSRGGASLSRLLNVIPGCQIGDQADAIAFADLILVAIPYNQLESLSAQALQGKVIMDATNYYPERDGHIAELDEHLTTTTQRVAKHLNQSIVIKAFNAILACDLVKDAVFEPNLLRRALPVAGDNDGAKERVIALYQQVGYDIVDAGSLSQSWRFERAKPAYCIALNKEQLVKALAEAKRDVELEHGSWR